MSGVRVSPTPAGARPTGASSRIEPAGSGRPDRALLSAIAAALRQLRPSEQKVAQAVLADPTG
jgi:hypothetical protein